MEKYLIILLLIILIFIIRLSVKLYSNYLINKATKNIKSEVFKVHISAMNKKELQELASNNSENELLIKEINEKLESLNGLNR